VVVKRGVVGGLLRGAAGLYLVYLSGFFDELASMMDEARLEVSNDPPASVAEVESLLKDYYRDALSILGDNAFAILIALIAWIAGTILFRHSWSRLMEYWPLTYVKLYRAAEWASRAAIIVGVAITAYAWLGARIGDAPFYDYAQALRYTGLAAFLYAAPLLLPLFYTVICIKSPPNGSRAGLYLLLIGSIIYIYTAYSVITTFRPFSEASTYIQEVLEGGLDPEDIGIAAEAVISTLNTAIYRAEGVVRALAIASIIHTLGFTLIELGDERLRNLLKVSTT